MEHRYHVTNRVVSTGAFGAIDDLADIGAVLALGTDASADVGPATAATADEEHERGTAGAASTFKPRLESTEIGRMEGGWVGDGVLLPWVRAGFNSEDGEIEKGWDMEEGGAPGRRVGGWFLGKIPGWAGHHEEMVVA